MTTQTVEQEQAERARLYKPSAKKAEIVNVPPIHFLMIDGTGDPNTSQTYKDAVEALYALSYTLKFALKKAEGVNYKVAPLEGLWWSDDMDAFIDARRDDWRWTMMIAQPSIVTQDRVDNATDDVRRKKNPPALPRMRFERFHEGLAAQVMHIGPYSAEAPTIRALHDFIRAQGYSFDGHVQKHHEIYLGDPRKSAPEKLKTVIRQSVIKPT